MYLAQYFAKIQGAMPRWRCRLNKSPDTRLLSYAGILNCFNLRDLIKLISVSLNLRGEWYELMLSVRMVSTSFLSMETVCLNWGFHEWINDALSAVAVIWHRMIQMGDRFWGRQRVNVVCFKVLFWYRLKDWGEPLQPQPQYSVSRPRSQSCTSRTQVRRVTPWVNLFIVCMNLEICWDCSLEQAKINSFHVLPSGFFIIILPFRIE